MHRYQNTTGSYASDTDEFWLYSLLKWWSDNAHIWGGDIEPHPSERRLRAFRLRVGMINCYRCEHKTGHMGTHVASSGTQIGEITVAARALADDYPEYNITTFHNWREIGDQILQIVPNVVQVGTVSGVCGQRLRACRTSTTTSHVWPQSR
jgi:hypothetical protein